MKRWSCALIAVAMIPGAVRPSVAQVRLGSVDLRLGSTKLATLEQLRTEFQVDSITGRDQWLIVTRSGPPFTAIGTVAFRTGRITLITREWTPGVAEPSQADVVRAVIGAMQTLLDDGQARCRVVDRSNRGPDFELSVIEIQCGVRRVSLEVTRSKGQINFSIAEMVGSDLQ